MVLGTDRLGQQPITAVEAHHRRRWWVTMESSVPTQVHVTECVGGHPQHRRRALGSGLAAGAVARPQNPNPARYMTSTLWETGREVVGGAPLAAKPAPLTCGDDFP